MTISQIVACSKNRVIGANNDLPWNIPEDMKFFRTKTKGKICIMGRKTFESIGKPFPHRLNIIITRQIDYEVEGAIVVSSLEEALDHSRRVLTESDGTWGNEIFICGGGEIYRQAMAVSDTLYVTEIHKEIEGDTTYPEVDLNLFEESERLPRSEPVPFDFVTYSKKK